jgi:fucose permease
MSILSGLLTLKKGDRFGIVAGLGIAGLGTFGFLPAAQMGSYRIRK